MENTQNTETSLTAAALALRDNLTVKCLAQYEEGAKDYLNGKVSFWKYVTCKYYRNGWDTAV